MYIPTSFREGNRETLLAFMRANSFAIVVSQIEGVPFATHIPVGIEERGDSIVLTGHVAKANPHTAAFESESETPSLVIFAGPHAYVSPSAYEVRESVPTWNYIAVHAVGVARAIRFADAPETISAMIEGMIEQFDSGYMAQWQSLSDKFRHGMMNGIVGFEMTVATLEGKYKLSQNRSKNDQASVMAMLSASDDASAQAVGEVMRSRHS